MEFAHYVAKTTNQKHRNSVDALLNRISVITVIRMVFICNFFFFFDVLGLCCCIGFSLAALQELLIEEASHTVAHRL